MFSAVSPLIFSLIVLVVLVGPIGLAILLRRSLRAEIAQDVRSLVAMTITVPREAERTAAQANEPLKDFKELIAPMEQFYSSLTTTIHKRSFIDWLFSSPAHISFELSSVGGVISFTVVCPKRIGQIVERQLHSFFPHAEVLVGLPAPIFSKETPAVSAIVLEQAKNFILPIKTYRYLEADPLQALTNALTKLQDGAASIQILIRPTNENWRTHTVTATGHVASGKMHLVNRGTLARNVGLLSEAIKPSQPIEQPKQMTPEQEEMIKALQEKGSKTGFETIIRVIATGKDENLAEANLSTLIAAFAQFYAPQFNSLKYRKVSPAKIARDYLLRLFSGAPKMILNVEELSSLYHLPTRLLETPALNGW